MGLDPRTDERSRLLADSDHLAILSVLDETERAVDVEELARRLVDRKVDLVRTPEYENRIEETVISLHHKRLPKLDEAGLVAYDPERTVVESQTPASPAIEWADDSVPDAVVNYLQTGSGGGSGIGTVQGRDSVIQYGRQLADEAEDELFCMYVSTDLLKDECIRRVRNAIERGATTYIGSQNPEVRRLTRERLPEATIWEPQNDWWNTRAHPRVGRLVLADRRHVMLAVLEESTADGTYSEETAIVGDGPDHPLVVLVRELLGPRLDHLDYQSEDFRSELPS